MLGNSALDAAAHDSCAGPDSGLPRGGRFPCANAQLAAAANASAATTTSAGRLPPRRVCVGALGRSEPIVLRFRHTEQQFGRPSRGLPAKGAACSPATTSSHGSSLLSGDAVGARGVDLRGHWPAIGMPEAPALPRATTAPAGSPPPVLHCRAPRADVLVRPESNERMWWGAAAAVAAAAALQLPAAALAEQARRHPPPCKVHITVSTPFARSCTQAATAAATAATLRADASSLRRRAEALNSPATFVECSKLQRAALAQEKQADALESAPSSTSYGATLSRLSGVARALLARLPACVVVSNTAPATYRVHVIADAARYAARPLHDALRRHDASCAGAAPRRGTASVALLRAPLARQEATARSRCR